MPGACHSLPVHVTKRLVAALFWKFFAIASFPTLPASAGDALEFFHLGLRIVPMTVPLEASDEPTGCFTQFRHPTAARRCHRQTGAGTQLRVRRRAVLPRARPGPGLYTGWG
jgi:hypothetical protein